MAPAKSRPVHSSRSAEFVHSSDDSSYARSAPPKSKPKKLLSKDIKPNSGLKDSSHLPRRPKPTSSQIPIIPDSKSGNPSQIRSLQSEPALPRYPKINGSTPEPSRSTARQVNGGRPSALNESDPSTSSESEQVLLEATNSEREVDDESEDAEERSPLQNGARKPLKKSEGLRKQPQPANPSTSNPLKRKRLSPSTSTSTSISEGDDSVTSSSESVSSDGQPVLSFQRLEPSIPQTIPYEPPPGFAPATISNISPSALEAFKPASSNGKQIWQISIPSSVPVDAITSVSLDSILDGSPIFTHSGIDYCLSTQREGLTDGETVLLPDVDKNRYEPAMRLKISRGLRVREVISRPSVSTTANNNVMDIDGEGVMEDKHKQPKGLKMRWRPFGDYDGDNEDEGIMQDVQPSSAVFRRPPTPNPTVPMENQEQFPAAGQQSFDKSPDGSRKESKQGNDPAALKSTHRRKHKKSGDDIFDIPSSTGSSQHLSASQPSVGLSSPSKQETAEQKARRREERKKRKAEKARSKGDLEG